MIKLLIIDFETTNVGENAKAAELSATLYGVGEKGEPSGAIATASSLLPITENSAQSINGIDPRLTQIFDSKGVIQQVKHMAHFADHLTAFNAPFDREFFLPLIPSVAQTPWICAMSDIDWMPGWIERPRSQVDLALSMGVGVLHAHRAGDDGRTLVALLDRLGDRRHATITDAIARAASPKMRAFIVDQPNRNKPKIDNSTYKSRGFYWDETFMEWARTIRDYDLARVRESWQGLGYRTICEAEQEERKRAGKIEIAACVNFNTSQPAKDAYFRWDAEKRLWIKEVWAWDYEKEWLSYPFKTEVL